MNIGLAVRLPIDVHSVPFARGLTRQALEHLGVERAVIDDIALALTEACANVVTHVAGREDYEVHVDINDALCRISVFDDGQGFDPTSPPSRDDDAFLEGGRGLLLMQALVDRLDFQRAPDGRHRVTLEKRLITQPLRLITST